MKQTRTKHSPELKAKVARGAIREQETVAEIARRYKLHANQVYKWKKEFMDKHGSCLRDRRRRQPRQ